MVTRFWELLHNAINLLNLALRTLSAFSSKRPWNPHRHIDEMGHLLSLSRLPYKPQDGIKAYKLIAGLTGELVLEIHDNHHFKLF